MGCRWKDWRTKKKKKTLLFQTPTRVVPVTRCGELTGKISKVCSVFRVMVSPSPAGADESDADRETHVNDTSTRSWFQFSPSGKRLTQVRDLQRDLYWDLQRRHRAGGGAAAATATFLQSRESDLEGRGGGTSRSGWCL